MLKNKKIIKKGCVFLSKKGQCSIHKFNPVTCKIYPFDFDVKGNNIIIFMDKFCPAFKDIKKNKEILRKIKKALNLLVPLLSREFLNHWRKLPFDSHLVEKIGEFNVG